jgi:hypothetical protein
MGGYLNFRTQEGLVTDESAGHRACVLAALEDRNAGDKRCFISIDTLYEAPAASGHVVDKLRLMQPQ